MIVLCVTNCPQQLRGDLTKWLIEVNTGIYVGKLNSRVRDELWSRVCENIKDGQASMVYTNNTEQGYSFLTHNSSWLPVDCEGVTLIKKMISINDLENKESEDAETASSGYSKAFGYKMSRRSGKKLSSYVIIDIETTGLNNDTDRILEVALIKIEQGKISDKYHCFINTDHDIPDDVKNITGISKEMVASQGITEAEAYALIEKFTGRNVLVGYNLNFDIGFLRKMAERIGKQLFVTRVKDVLDIARRRLGGLENYKLKTVAEYFSLDTSTMHRAMSDCELVYGIYEELNKL